MPDTKDFPAKLLNLPHALEAFQDLIMELGGGQPAVFLDYDGTLTDIVSNPGQAVLADPVRESLQGLAGLTLTGIISGRDLNDVRRLVRVQGLLFAGSHGFDLFIPGQGRLEPHPLPTSLDQAENDLRALVQDIPGILLERKRYSLAVHSRQASGENASRVQGLVHKAMNSYPHLRSFTGKKVIEIQPNVEWDKGRALLHILELLPSNQQPLYPIYVGDDTTDETAFRAVAGMGLGICVGDEDRLTQAAYRLDNPHQVHIFLDRLSQWLAKKKPDPR
ncbi:MAG: trehalose-phosphatase [Desulfovermiculus sp.]|nr:trehalose-phosphatase [Desulfovermiculus sp.]